MMPNINMRSNVSHSDETKSKKRKQLLFYQRDKSRYATSYQLSLRDMI